jgi:hypothetical protein
MSIPESYQESEASRRERLRELRRSPAPQAGLPDPVHTALVLMKAVDDKLASHPDVAADPDLYHLAFKAFEALFELHNALGGQIPPALAEGRR